VLQQKPSRQNLINKSRRQQHQGQQEITSTITGGGAKGFLGGNDKLKTLSDSKKRGERKAATPTTATGRSALLNTAREKVRGTQTQQEKT
jgi:hypothetical protein